MLDYSLDSIGYSLPAIISTSQQAPIQAWG